MAALARSSGIKVLLCSVLPSIRFPWSEVDLPAEMIATLNDKIKAYASNNGHGYVDDDSAMVDDQGGLKVPDYTAADDLVHPNETGYKVIEKVILAHMMDLID